MLKEYAVYLENAYGDVLDVTSVDAKDQEEAITLGDTVFRESEYPNGYPEGYNTVAYLAASYQQTRSEE